MGERWSPLDEANARAAQERAERLKNGPPARRRSPSTAAAGKPRAAQRFSVGRLAALFLVLLGLGMGRAVLQDSWGPSASKLNGRCVTIEGVEPDRRLSEIRCGWEHSGKVIAAIPAVDTCPAGTDTTFTLKSDKDHTLCIDLDL